MRSRIPSPLLLLLRLIALGLAVAMFHLATAKALSHKIFGFVDMGLGGTLERQIEMAETALALNPALGRAWLRLSMLHMHERDLDSALAAAEMAARTTPAYRPHHLVAEILYTHALNEGAARFDALDALDRALAIYPDDFVMLDKAAWVAIWLGDFDRAREYVDRTEDQEIRPNDMRLQTPETLSLWGELASRTGEVETALRLYDLLLEIDPGNWRAAQSLAALLDEGLANPRHAYDLLRSSWRPNLGRDEHRIAVRQAIAQDDSEFLGEIVRELFRRHVGLPRTDSTLERLITEALRGLTVIAVEQSDPRECLSLLTDFPGSDLAESGAERSYRLLVDPLVRDLAEHMTTEDHAASLNLLVDTLANRHRDALGAPAWMDVLIHDCTQGVMGGDLTGLRLEVIAAAARSTLALLLRADGDREALRLHFEERFDEFLARAGARRDWSQLAELLEFLGRSAGDSQTDDADLRYLRDEFLAATVSELASRGAGPGAAQLAQILADRAGDTSDPSQRWDTDLVRVGQSALRSLAHIRPAEEIVGIADALASRDGSGASPDAARSETCAQLITAIDRDRYRLSNGARLITALRRLTLTLDRVGWRDSALTEAHSLMLRSIGDGVIATRQRHLLDAFHSGVLQPHLLGAEAPDPGLVELNRRVRRIIGER